MYFFKMIFEDPIENCTVKTCFAHCLSVTYWRLLWWTLVLIEEEQKGTKDFAEECHQYWMG